MLILQAKDTDYIYIGDCKDGKEKQKQRSLQMGCPYELIALNNGPEAKERYLILKELIDHYHVRGGWYKVINVVLASLLFEDDVVFSHFVDKTLEHMSNRIHVPKDILASLLAGCPQYTIDGTRVVKR